MIFNGIEFWWTKTEVFIYKNGVLWQHGGEPWVRACSCCATPELKNEWKIRDIQLGGVVPDELMNGFPSEEEWLAVEIVAKAERPKEKLSLEKNKKKEKILHVAIDLLRKQRFSDATIYCKMFQLDFEKLFEETYGSIS